MRGFGGRDEEGVRRGEGKIREEGRPIKGVDGEVGGKGEEGRGKRGQREMDKGIKKMG